MSGKIDISRKQFENSYRNHYYMYLKRSQDIKMEKETWNSRCLLLFYAVECGLKVLLLKELKKNYYSDLEKYLKNRQIYIKGHDIKGLAKLSSIKEERVLKPIRLKKGQVCAPCQYNEFWRYGAEPEDEEEVREAENTLKKLAESIGERIGTMKVV